MDWSSRLAVLAILAFWVGSCIGVFIAWIFLVRSSFRESTALGFATLVFWPISVLTLAKHWGVKGKDIRYAFFITLIGTMVFGGALWIGLSAYRDFTVSARVSEAASLSGAARTAVEVAYKEGLTLGALPSHTSLGLAAPASYSGKYVRSVAVNRQGVVTVSLTNNRDLSSAANGTLTYTPTVQGGELVWTHTCNFADTWCPRR